ncbi:MAG TPA: hypothetical protein DHU80_07295, partial [Cryomorphaceae bacterium]|nr:hypothetical protein [Cryomorphaceae bacterium]
GKGLYKIQGRVSEEFGFYTVEASALYKVAMVPDPRYTDTISRSSDNYSKSSQSMKGGINQTNTAV